MNERARRSVLGALVADAASLGTHWIYDVERVQECGGETPEFLAPNLENYRGIPAYFAHKGKQPGDLTHYGEQLMVGLRGQARADDRAQFDVAAFEKEFLAAFGPGGTWVGYIDYATRETLRNIDLADRAALDAAKSIELGEWEKDRRLLEAKVMAHAKNHAGRALELGIERAVRITHPEDDELVALTQRMAHAVREAQGGARGADDNQLPAVSRLSGLVAAGADDDSIDTAIAATNHSAEAKLWAVPVRDALRAAVDGASARDAVHAAAERAPDAIAGKLRDVLASESAEAVAAEFGRACPLPQSVPVSFAVAAHADGFVDAVRTNIRTAGDNAGRGTIIGALFGAGELPEAWVARVPAAAEAASILDA